MHGSVKLIGVMLCFGAFGLAFSRLHPSSISGAERDPASVEKNPQTGKLLESAIEPVAYHFERTVHAELRGHDGKPLLDLSLQGTVFVTELSRTDDTHLLSLQFELIQGTEKQSHDSHLPFLIEVSNRQAVISVKTVAAVVKDDEDDLNVLRDFSSLFAYGSDRDTSGIYHFRLKRKGDQIKKSKLSYEGAAQSTPQVVSSETQAAIDAVSGAWIKGSGKEQTRMAGFGSAQDIFTTSSFKIERLNGNEKPKFTIVTSPDLKETSLALVSKAELEPRSWAELKKELALIRQFSRSKRLSLFHDLTKLLKSDSKMVAEFKSYIESVSGETGLMTFGVGVLATAGSESAQTALRDWYQGKYGQEHTILNAFSTANAQLTEDSRSFLREVASRREVDPELAQNAVFALGSALKHTNDEDARRTLLGYYANSQTESDRLNALDAMGNSGDVQFLPTLKQAMASGSPAERERAVFGVRFLPADSAAPILRAAYQDANPAIRQASIRALQYQEPLSAHAALVRDCAVNGESACQSMAKRLTP